MTFLICNFPSCSTQTTMPLPSAHCSRAFSVITRSTARKTQLGGAALDRYSVIRNFFRSQTAALSTLPNRNHTSPTKAWSLSTPQDLVCGRRKSLHLCLSEGYRAPRGQVQERLRSGTARNTRPLGRCLSSFSVGFNLHVSHGGARWIHGSAVCANSGGGTPNKSEPSPDTRPPTSPPSSDPEEPPIPKHENSQQQTCTCANARVDDSQKPSTPHPDSKPNLSQSQPTHHPIDPANPPKHLEDYSRFFRRLALLLPHPHRPTREDFLNVATGFWQRLRIRFKWFTIKSFRKFNADDISAFVTWFLMSQTLWILIGT